MSREIRMRWTPLLWQTRCGKEKRGKISVGMGEEVGETLKTRSQSWLTERRDGSRKYLWEPDRRGDVGIPYGGRDKTPKHALVFKDTISREHGFCGLKKEAKNPVGGSVEIEEEE